MIFFYLTIPSRLVTSKIKVGKTSVISLAGRVGPYVSNGSPTAFFIHKMYIISIIIGRSIFNTLSKVRLYRPKGVGPFVERLQP